MRYVGVGRRFLAVVIDAVVGIVWSYPFADVERRPGFFGVHLRGGGFGAAVAITILYFVVMEGLFGATIGKFATGIRVVRADGTRLGVGAAVIRNLLRVIDVLPTAYLLGAILVWTSSKKQRLGDRLAKTVVVEASSVGVTPGRGDPSGAEMWTPSPIAPGGITPPPMPPPPPMPGETPPVSDPGPVPPQETSPPPEVEQS